MSFGIRKFHKLSDAIAAGYQVYDRTVDGYLVRIRENDRWQIAIVQVV